MCDVFVSLVLRADITKFESRPTKRAKTSRVSHRTFDDPNSIFLESISAMFIRTLSDEKAEIDAPFISHRAMASGQRFGKLARLSFGAAVFPPRDVQFSDIVRAFHLPLMCVGVRSDFHFVSLQTAAPETRSRPGRIVLRAPL